MTGLRTLLAAAAISVAFIQPPHPPDRFATVNGVRLHYLDWGGNGDVLLFLAGLGDSVHRFDAFAPKFVDRFRVLGFTRRGQEESGTPADGYDLRSLVDDIRGFLDVEGVQRATLIGHSIAGAEMTTFASMYPNRLTALVYLDAAYDNARAYERFAANGLATVNPDRSLEAIARASRVHPDYARLTVPALAFFVVYDKPPVGPELSESARQRRELLFRVLGELQREQAALFKANVTNSRVVEWHDTNHMFFDDPKHSDEAARIIREFLGKK